MGVDMGPFHYNFGSLHCYENNFDILKENFEFVKNVDEYEQPFRPMIKEDVAALLKQDYSINTPFMEDFRKYGRIPLTEWTKK
jgi:thymidylate synthase